MLRHKPSRERSQQREKQMLKRQRHPGISITWPHRLQPHALLSNHLTLRSPLLLLPSIFPSWFKYTDPAVPAVAPHPHFSVKWTDKFFLLLTLVWTGIFCYCNLKSIEEYGILRSLCLFSSFILIEFRSPSPDKFAWQLLEFGEVAALTLVFEIIPGPYLEGEPLWPRKVKRRRRN